MEGGGREMGENNGTGAHRPRMEIYSLKHVFLEEWARLGGIKHRWAWLRVGDW